MKKPRKLLVAGGAVLAAILLCAPAARAQSEGDGFLFGAPTGSVALRGGFDQPFLGGDLYSYFANEFTLSRKNFAAFDVAGDVAFRVRPLVDIVLGTGVSYSEAPSKYRSWLDNNNLPIQQKTSLLRVPITASVKLYLARQGRSIGRFVWVPGGVSPYVGAGIGALWYHLHQWGDFINFADTTHPVLPDELNSDDWALAGHAFAGVDIPIGPRWMLTAEARYTYAKAGVGGDYQGYNGFDLSGVSVTAGFAVRF